MRALLSAGLFLPRHLYAQRLLQQRQAAEAFLAERGIELHWQPPASTTTRILTPRSGQPRFLQL